MTQIDEVKGTSNGRWMRLDLHIHTPASEDYAETSVSFLEILQEAERHHLDVIAFTDHNTVHGYGQFRDEIDFLHRLVTANRCTDDERERYNEYQRLLEKMTVLPGFEFTSHYGAHILGIFAPETPLSILEAVLLQLGVTATDIKRGSCSIPNTKHVTEAYEIINRNGGIVIAAHVNAPSGVVSETIRMGTSGQSRAAATQSPHLHALEFVHFYTSHDTFLSPSFYNGQHEHYTRPMICIQGSDAHRVRHLNGNSHGYDNDSVKHVYGVGDRYFEALLPDRSFASIKAMFTSGDPRRVRVQQRDQKQWEIDQLRLNGETQTLISRPAERAAVEAAWQDIAALSNADGGVLLIGMQPSNEFLSPPEVSERIRTTVGQLEPQPHTALELVRYDGREVIRVEVEPVGAPPCVASNGVIYVRRDNETVTANRDEILHLARRALVGSMMSPLDNGEDLELPRSGVEIVSEQKRGGMWTYEVRDLRTTTGVERERAQGLWAYAISRHEELRDARIDLNTAVRWYGRLGVWRTFQQGVRAKYDLVHRDSNGVIDHIFYGVSEWGLGEGWRTLLGLAPESSEAHDPEQVNDDTAPIVQTNSESSEPVVDPNAWMPWGDREYRWKGRGGLWRIYGSGDDVRYDLAMKNKDDDGTQEFRDVTKAKLSEAWVNLIRVKPPTTGIEVVSAETNEFGQHLFRFRNLRTSEISEPWRDIDLEPGTVREYAARMYLDDMPIDESTVRWWGNIGYMRPMRSQVDLVYRDQEGVDHIYYAARREELENEWRELLTVWTEEA